MLSMKIGFFLKDERFVYLPHVFSMFIDGYKIFVIVVANVDFSVFLVGQPILMTVAWFVQID